jgi:hypothetical protein
LLRTSFLPENSRHRHQENQCEPEKRNPADPQMPSVQACPLKKAIVHGYGVPGGTS